MKISSFGPEAHVFDFSKGKVRAVVSDFGCTIINLFVNDKNGKSVDVVLGYDDFEDWLNGTEAHNALVGRFANRIAGGTFELDGKKFTLDKNSGENCLHGGFTRWEKIIWNAEPFENDEEAGVVFSGTSAAGEQGFPGNLSVRVKYSLNKNNELCLEFFAKSDEATPVNLTNHAYFNLNGQGSILDHTIQLECDEILEAKDMIPTGKFLSLKEEENSVFDFRVPKKAGKDIKQIDEGIRGYDHCYLTHGKEQEAVYAGFLESEESGIKMEILTNQRGLQLYTGNWLDGIKGKAGVVHCSHDGVCFEAQRFPDSPNRSEFGNCILRPGQEYHSITIYRFI